MGTFQNIEAVNYLLGRLGEREQESVEQKYFRDPAAFDDLLMAESELYDAYARGELAENEKNLFERRLLISDKQRQRAGFAGALLKYFSREELVQPAAVPKAGWASTIRKFLTSQPLLAYSFASIILIVMVGAIWWSAIDRNQTRDEIAHSTDSAGAVSDVVGPGQDLSQPSSSVDNALAAEGANEPTGRPITTPKVEKPVKGRIPPIISTIILSAGSTRGDGEEKVLVVRKGSKQIELQLKFEPGEHSSYFAVVETPDGQQIWSGKAGHKADTATVRFPAGRIKTGDFIVTLKGLNSSRSYETVAEYSFAIKRQ